MESIYTDLALYDSKNECFRNDAVFLRISQVCDGAVSFEESPIIQKSHIIQKLTHNRGVGVIGQ